MLAPTRSGCPRCGREPSPGDHSCQLCGELLARAAEDPGPVGGSSPLPPDVPPTSLAAGALRPGVPGVHPGLDVGPAATGPRTTAVPWLYLGIGALLYPLLLLPLPAWIGWYFSALVHEMGHAAAAWFLGCPAVPALGVGEAVTVSAARVLPLTLVIWVSLSILAWRMQAGAARWVALALAGGAYPLLAFSSSAELAKLVAGHGAELAFAVLALWRGMTGGFTSSAAERGLYSVVGWYLLLDNLRLTTGLMTSAAARAEYASCGSFGCINDYIRVADTWFGGSLEGVAFLASLAALAVLPLALVARRWLAPMD